MAEIHVQTKKPSTNASWVWIVLALLIIGALVYYLMTRNNQEAQPVRPSQPDAASQISPKPPKPERVQTVIPIVYMCSV